MRSRLLLLALVALTHPALAVDDDSRVRLSAPGLIGKQGPQRAPDVKASPQAWPRLDPGAFLCRTEADLARLAARQNGDPVDGPVNCQPVRVATAIQIVQRAGPGRTEVRVSDKPNVSGWTNAWLPERAPSPH